MADKRELLRLLERDVRAALLASSSSALGKVLWDGATNTGALLVFNLPPLPSRKVYQLWRIKGKTSIDAGTFTVNPPGNGMLKLKDVCSSQGQIEMFAVTIEPTGGSSHPTGRMLLKSSPSRS